MNNNLEKLIQLFNQKQTTVDDFVEKYIKTWKEERDQNVLLKFCT